MIGDEELSNIACDLILQAFTDLAVNKTRLYEELVGAGLGGECQPGDEDRLAQMIKDGREMFHEIWAMGS